MCTTAELQTEAGAVLSLSHDHLQFYATLKFNTHLISFGRFERDAKKLANKWSEELNSAGGHVS